MKMSIPHGKFARKKKEFGISLNLTDGDFIQAS